MKRLIFFALCFAFAVSAEAHPLGNFSVNQYSRLEIDGRAIKIRQVLDLAEIPTFQLAPEIDADRDGALSPTELDLYLARLTPQIIGNLALTVDGARLEISEEAKRISLPPGAGELPTLRAEWDLTAELPPLSGTDRVRFENGNYAERLGWREIVLARAGSVGVFDANAFASGLTDELKAYPAASLDAPLDERTAEFFYTRGAIPDGARPLVKRDGHAAAAIEKDRLAELIAVPRITPAIALAGLLVAFGLGALHALSPGHGKAVVGAYLVGSRGTAKHAVFLGLTVTVTHTLGVFALGLVTLFASNFILPERLLPFLSFVSGLIVFYIGLTMFKTRLFDALGRRSIGHQHDDHADHHGPPSHEGHFHDHADDAFTHTHDGHTHSHLPPAEISWKSLAALGVSGGLLPCPSALVLMLSAISLGRAGYGLILTTAFSSGLAATLTAVGLAFLYLGKAFAGTGLAETRIFKTLPVASAFVIACLGALICYQSLG